MTRLMDASALPRYSAFVDRLRAAGLHLIVSVLVALPAAGLVFYVWYPAGLARILGGLELFLLVSGCDVVLGPLISLVIFNRLKPRRELVRDYAIVALVQLGALVYGLHVVSLSRPVFVAFTKDRLEVVTAIELDPSDRAQASSKVYQSLPLFGPIVVGTAMPLDPRERSEALFIALEGKDIHLRPKYYDEYRRFRADILAHLRPVELLAQERSSSAKSLIDVANDHKDGISNVGWLALRHRFGFGVALIDRTTAEPFLYLPIDPPDL